MKSAVALAVLFLVCGMRARLVEDDVKDMGAIKGKLKIFLDYVEVTMKQSLTEMGAQFNKIYFDTNKHRYHIVRNASYINVIEPVSMKCRIRDLHLIAAEREVDTSECDEKIDALTEIATSYSIGIEKCAWNVARKLIEPTQKARNDIYQIIFDIEDRVETAKKCVADATLSTSFSAAKCLTKTIHAAEMAWFKAPGKRELLEFKRRYPLSVKQLEDCKQPRAIEDLKVAVIQAEREVIDCMSESIVNKALKKIT